MEQIRASGGARRFRIGVTRHASSPDIDQTGDGAGAEPPKSVSSPPPSGRLSRGLRKSSKSRTRRPLSRHAHKYLHILLCSSRMLTTTHATRGGPSGGLNPGHPTPCSPLRARDSPPGTHGAGAVRGSAGGGVSGSPPPPSTPRPRRAPILAPRGPDVVAAHPLLLERRPERADEQVSFDSNSGGGGWKWWWRWWW